MLTALQKIRLLAQKARALDKIAASEVDMHVDRVYATLRARLEAQAPRPLRELRVLDFGCGYTYPLLVLLGPEVREVVGLEVSPTFQDGIVRTLTGSGALRGPGRLLDTILDHWRARRFFQHLERRTGRPVRHPSFRVVKYDGRRIPLPDASFDAIISNAVLQELPLPLEPFSREMSRLLAPGGIIDLEWHNFYAWSGHVLGSDESRRRPWGHLLGGHSLPGLNRVTPDAVREAFQPCFENLRLLPHDRDHRIVGQDPEYQPEAKQYLTEELARRLAAYPRDLLLTRGFILQGQVRAA